MKFYRLLFIFTVASLLFTSCNTYRQIVFMQDKEKFKEKTYQTMLDENIIRIQPEDVLAITINAPGHQEIVHDFNLPLQPVATTYGSGHYVDMSVGRQTYMVDRNGEILVPVLGRIQVAGYTTVELEEHFRKLLTNTYLRDVNPVVTIRMMNFSIFFLGEKSGRISIGDKEHVTIFEALSMAGTIGIQGSRQITLIRPMPGGQQKHIKLDLSKSSIISSPYYYLHQNDMIYVTPSQVAMRSYLLQDMGTLFSFVTFALSTISLIYLIKNI